MTTEATPGALGSNDQLGLEPGRKKLDAFDWHEALDRAALFANLVDAELLQLAAVQSDDEVRRKIERAASELAESYQILGRRRFAAGSAETMGPNGPVEAGPTVLRWTSPRTGG